MCISDFGHAGLDEIQGSPAFGESLDARSHRRRFSRFSDTLIVSLWITMGQMAKLDPAPNPAQLSLP